MQARPFDASRTHSYSLNTALRTVPLEHQYLLGHWWECCITQQLLHEKCMPKMGSLCGPEGSKPSLGSSPNLGHVEIY
jgi:hypothetical protein